MSKDPIFDSFDAFKDRIRYYHYNKNARPKHSGHKCYNFSVQYNNKDNSDNKKPNELEKYPIRSVFGGLEVACGILIAIIPFPFCREIGGTIIPVRKNKDAFLSNLPSASLKDLFFSIYLICTTKRSFKSTAANRKNATLFFRNGIIGHGLANMYEGYMQKLEEGQKDKHKSLI